MITRFRTVAVGAALGAVLWIPSQARAQTPTPPGAPPAVAPRPVPNGGAAADPAADLDAVRDEFERLRAEFAEVQRQYDARLSALEQLLTKLTPTPAAAQDVAVQAPPPASPQEPASPPVQGALPPSSARVFNPDMSVNGNFVGFGGKNPFGGPPSLELTEVEAAFQAVIDPYARADFFLAASPEGLEVEEGYITFTSLPGNFLLKAGKMRAQFGKVNALHTHAMPTVDRPLVTEYLVGGEEGLSDAGLSLSHLIQNPYLFLEATGEVYAAASDVFSTTTRSRLNYVGRLRAYHDLSEDKNIEVGTSFAFGPAEGFVDPSESPVDLRLNKRLVGFDATFRYRPLRRAIYQRLNLRTEMVWNRQDVVDATPVSAFGLYGLGEYQFARRWYAGARFDRSARPLDPDSTDNGGAVFLTFWPTEFSQIRTQYRRLNFAEGTNANEVMFQLNFSIGAHGAHAF
jgi:hypothetical protein